MITRNIYLNQLKDFIGKPFIKVITGIRRSGKSVLLMLLKQELLKSNIAAENIIYINFESFTVSDLKNSKHLYGFIKSKITNNKKYYILLDEIQEVTEWEKVINALQVDFDTDIYITGSNSRLHSS